MPLFNDDANVSVIYPHPGFASGKYYASSIFISTIGTSFNTGFVYYTYFYLPFQQSFNRLGFTSNSSFSSPISARFGVYKISSGLPSTLLSDLGEISFTSSGFKEISCSLFLTAGWYAIATSFSGTLTILYPNITLGSLIGTISSFSGGTNGLRATLNYGAFPSNASVASLTDVSSPLIWLKAA